MRIEPTTPECQKNHDNHLYTCPVNISAPSSAQGDVVYEEIPDYEPNKNKVYVSLQPAVMQRIRDEVQSKVRVRDEVQSISIQS